MLRSQGGCAPARPEFARNMVVQLEPEPTLPTPAGICHRVTRRPRPGGLLSLTPDRAGRFPKRRASLPRRTEQRGARQVLAKEVRSCRIVNDEAIRPGGEERGEPSGGRVGVSGALDLRAERIGAGTGVG